MSLKDIIGKTEAEIESEAKQEFEVGKGVILALNPKKINEYGIRFSDKQLTKIELIIPYSAILCYSILNGQPYTWMKEIEEAMPLAKARLVVNEEVVTSVNIKWAAEDCKAFFVTSSGQIKELSEDYFVIKPHKTIIW